LTKFGPILKKNKNLNPNDPEEFGDCWSYTANKRKSGFMIAYSAGKRVYETCEKMLTQFFERMALPYPDSKILISTDGNPQYSIILSCLYCNTCIEYGQVVKVKENNILIRVNKEQIVGNMKLGEISTSIVEGYNNKIRQRLSRFVRRTASFSKTLIGYKASMDLFQFVNNFIEIKKEKKTPAMIEGVTNFVWGWEQFLNHHLQL
jgi:IS1 family transposase